MSSKILTDTDVMDIFPHCTVVGKPLKGGQKIVYPCLVNGIMNAVKFIVLNSLDDVDNIEEVTSQNEEITARAIREISIMKQIDSDYLVRLGEIDFQLITHKNQQFLAYSEEWIEGTDVANQLRSVNKLDVLSTINLGADIAKAIELIWNTNNVHRDIKPQNIMRRNDNGKYVLLDFGMAFDTDDKSLTKMGCVPGTRTYFSPEQLDWKNKRDIDFRSDLFSLGIVLYQVLTGIHPFYKNGMYDQELFNNILHATPIQPILFEPSIPKELNDIVMRLLNKSPHARYRKCSLLINQLEEIKIVLEG